LRRGGPKTGQGSNSTLVGDFNERVVLTTLRRRGPSSKAELARLVGLTKNAAGEIVRKLESNGLVKAVGKRTAGRGQPATILDLDPQGAYAIGVRIDRDLIECLLVDLGGRILDRDILEDLPEPPKAVATIAATVAHFRRRLGSSGRHRLAGIGVAIPSNLGSWLTELGLPAKTFRAWDQFDLKTALATATDAVVVLENDGNAAAVGEMNHGCGREMEDFLYVFLGPAVGGGVVLDGDYIRGRRGNAGDLGLMPVRPSHLPSAPASGRAYDPLLSRASVKTLMRHYAANGLPATSRSELEQVIGSHPSFFDEWKNDAVDALVGPVLASTHLLDISTVVLDGDLAPALLDCVAADLSAALAAATAESRVPPDVMRGTLGRDAAAIGAASLPLHMSFSPMRDVLTRRPNGFPLEAHP